MTMACTASPWRRWTHGAELLGKPVYTDMDEWTGEEITVEPVATSTGQSLEWNCNDGLLYWTQYDSESEDWFNTAMLFQIHPETAACQKQPANFFDDPVVALFVRDLDRHEDAGWSQMTEQVEQVALSASTMTLKQRRRRSWKPLSCLGPLPIGR